MPAQDPETEILSGAGIFDASWCPVYLDFLLHP
jgi:hypothetical protein